MEEFQADILVFFITFLSICYSKNEYKWSDMQNVIYSILQFILQYGSSVLQYIAIHFFAVCFTPSKYLTGIGYISLPHNPDF